MSRPASETADINERSQGSPVSSEPVFLAIGKLRRPHGVHGEIQMEVWTDFPQRLKRLITVYVGPDYRPMTLIHIRMHGQLLLLSFDGFTTPEEVGQLRNQVVYTHTKSLPKLPEGEYYHHQLIGLRVVDEAGQVLGSLSEIIVTGANDVYVVRAQNGAEHLMPAIEDVILGVDLKKGEMRVRPQNWE